MRLALFEPDIPQNVGAAIRAAACFGAALDVIEPCGFPLDAREIRRVAMDYRLAAPVTAHRDWRAFLETIAGARLILFTTSGATSLWESSLRPDDILLFGRESAGAPDHVHDRADFRLRIPIADGARALNVATAAAIALAEARRQFGWSGA